MDESISGGEVDEGGFPGGDPQGGSADPGVGAAAASRGQFAKIRCLDQVCARGFTFSKGKVVAGVPLAHAEYLAAGGKAEVLEVC